ncbi:Ig-like domain-containing protein, partial [Marinomonas dokdonensis]|uniref:Ig-like domain-containing protein n=1 Tax=Marinomonas dokdonensis TaxID=328224 RepID=UPI004055845B
VSGQEQSFTASEIATGAVTVEVEAGELVEASVKDAAGNISIVSEKPVVVDLSADDQGDALSIVVADTLTKDVATVTVQGVDEDAQSVTVTFVNGDKSEKVTLTQTDPARSEWVFTDTDLSALGNGDVNIIATVTDKAGNTAEITLNAGLEVDVTPLSAPTLSLVGDTSNDGIFNYDELGSDGTATVKITLPLGFDASEDTLVVTVSGQEQSFTASEIATGAVTVEVGAGELVEASVKDAAGNISTVSEKPVVVDLSADNQGDALSIVVADTITKDVATVTVQGVDEDAQSVTVTFVNGDKSEKVTLTHNELTAGKWVFTDTDLSSLGSGDVNIIATVTDKAGNTAEVTLNAGLEVDVTPLSAPTLSLVGDTSNDGIFNYDELGSDGTATVKITLPLGFDASEDTLVVTVSGQEQSFTASEIATGAVTVEVEAGELVEASVKDAAGNISTVSEKPVVVDLSADDQGDALSIVVADTLTKDVATVTVQGVDDDAQSVTVTFVNGDKSEKVTLTQTDPARSEWVFTDTDLSALGNGDVNIIATVTDKAGNTAEITLNAGLEVDVTPLSAPTLSLVGDTSNDGIFNYDELGSDGTATVKITLPLGFDASEDTLVVTVSGQEQSFTASEIATGAVTVEVEAGELVEASVKDAAGNISTVSEKPVVVDLSADNQGDALSIVVADTLTKDVATVTVQGVDEDAQSVTVTFVNGDKSEKVTLTQAELTDGKWVFTDTDLTSLDDGNINIIAMVTDKAGNTAEVTVNAGIILDTIAVAGTVTVDDITADDIINIEESTSTISVSGTASGGDISSGDKVSLVINNIDYETTVDATGDWSIDVSGADLAADPSFEVVVTSTDNVGNQIESRITSTHEIDLSAFATINVDAITADSIINANEAATGNFVAITGAVKGDALPGDTITVRVDGDVIGSGEVSGQLSSDGNYYLYTVNVLGSDLVDSNDLTREISVTVSGTDSAGNPFEQSNSQTYVVDQQATAGVVTINSITNDNVIDALELAHNIDVTGTALGGDISKGDTVTIAINNYSYTTVVGDNGDWQLTVPASELVQGTMVSVSVDSVDPAGNTVKSSATKSYSVDLSQDVAITVLEGNEHILSNLPSGFSFPTGTDQVTTALGGTILLVDNQYVYRAPIVDHAGSAVRDDTVTIPLDDGRSFIISIDLSDSVPVAKNDSDSVIVQADDTQTAGAEYDFSTTSGNVFHDNGSGADVASLDGSMTVIGAAIEGDTILTPVVSSFTVDGTYGTLVINADGTYQYEATANFLSIPEDAIDTFSYLIQDGDGSKATADLVINVGKNYAPTAVDDSSTTLSSGWSGLVGTYYGTDDAMDTFSDFISFVSQSNPSATFNATDINYSSTSSESVATGTNLQVFLGDDSTSLDVDPQDNSYGGVQFKGYIYLQAGNYNFLINASGSYQILVDSQNVASNSDIQTPVETTHEGFDIAEDGYYEIDMIWFGEGVNHTFQASISSDGGNNYASLDSSLLSQGHSGLLEVGNEKSLLINAETLLLNDSDNENSALTISSIDNVSNGYAYLNTDGNIMFIAEAGFIGTASFDYTVTDGAGGFNTATASIEVSASTILPNVAVSLEQGVYISTDTHAIDSSTNWQNSSSSADYDHYILGNSSQAYYLSSSSDSMFVKGSVTDQLSTKDGDDKVYVRDNLNEEVGDSNITLNLGAGDDQLIFGKAYQDGATPGSSKVNGRVLGGSGHDEIQIDGSVTATGQLLAGTGNDKVFMTGDMLGSTSMGSGDDSLVIGGNVTGKITTSSGSDGVIIKGDVTNDVLLDDNDSQSGGDDFLTIGGSASGNYTIYAGTGDDSIEISGDSSVQIELDDTSLATGGNDTLFIKGSSSSSILAGAGDDIITISVNSTGAIQLGEGNDYLAVGGSVSNTIDAGDGNDTLTIFGNSSSNIDLGSGNDYLSIDGSTGQEINAGTGDDFIVIGGDLDYLISGGDGSDAIILKNYTKAQYDANENDLLNRVQSFENIMFSDGMVIGDKNVFSSFQPNLPDSSGLPVYSYEVNVAINHDNSNVENATVNLFGIPMGVTLQQSGIDVPVNQDGSYSFDITSGQTSIEDLSIISFVDIAEFDITTTVTKQVDNSIITDSYQVGTDSSDELIGSGGSDVLFGGFDDQVDELTGGSGNDVFILNKNSIDIINDFNAVEDALDLTDILATIAGHPDKDASTSTIEDFLQTHVNVSNGTVEVDGDEVAEFVSASSSFDSNLDNVVNINDSIKVIYNNEEYNINIDG